MADKTGGGSFFRTLKGVLFEDEPGSGEKSQEVSGGDQITPAVIPVAKVPTTVTPKSVDVGDRTRMIEAISKRIFTSGTPYEEYRVNYVNLTSANLAEPDRKRAAWSLVIAKHGLTQVMEAMNACQVSLAEERGAFETSLNPKQGNGVIAETNKAKEQVLQDIAERRVAVERLNREIAELEAKEAELDQKVAEEQAKQEHARAVFEVAYSDIEQGIKADIQFVSAHLPPKA